MEIKNMVDGKIVSINGKPIVETPKPIVVVEEPKKKVKPTPTPIPNDEIDIEEITLDED